MRPEESTQPEPTTSATSTAGNRPHGGVVTTSALLATALGVATGWYALASGLYVLKALALILLQAAHASWATLGAERVRRLFAEAQALSAQRGASRDRTDAPRGSAGPDDDYDLVFADAEHGRKLFYLFGAIVPALVLAVLAVGMLIGDANATATEVVRSRATALGIVCLAVSSLWLVLWRTYGAVSSDELSEAPFLCLTFREAQWATLVAAAGLFGRMYRPEIGLWLGRILVVWLLLVAAELLLRLFFAWLRPSKSGPFIPPFRVFLRELVLSRGNPVSSLFETIEGRFGVSFRSSWAIRFVKNAALPTVLLAGLLFWALSSLSMVGPSEMGIRETLGTFEKQPLGPGLHLKLPWPLAQVHRYPVKRVFSQPVGFVAADEQPAAFLWSNVHAKEEFELILGDGTEAVAVNVVLYYKIREGESLYDYALNFENPDEALEGYSYRALMELTRSATLEELLSANRAKFADDLHRAIQQYSDANRLGIDVIEVALLNLHPPTEAAESYLDVISARIDAERFQIEAQGEQVEQVESALTEKTTIVAEAKIEAARRVANAIKESVEFAATKMAYAVSPAAFRFRVRGDTLAEILSEKPLVLLDRVFSAGPGETMADFREDAVTDDEITSGVK